MLGLRIRYFSQEAGICISQRHCKIVILSPSGPGSKDDGSLDCRGDFRLILKMRAVSFVSFMELQNVHILRQYL